MINVLENHALGVRINLRQIFDNYSEGLRPRYLSFGLFFLICIELKWDTFTHRMPSSVLLIKRKAAIFLSLYLCVLAFVNINKYMLLTINSIVTV